MKKFLSFVLCFLMVVSMPLTAMALEDKIPPKSNSEFGTLTGIITATPTTNYVTYKSSTTKKASRLSANIELCFYTTGERITTDGVTRTNSVDASYYNESGGKYLSSKLSVFGVHEARGKTSLVGYTGISNF